MDISSLLAPTIEIAVETGTFIKSQRDVLTAGDIQSKGIHDYVTRVDKESEQMLVKHLSALLPESGFLTEEKTTEQKEKPYTWIIDPLDGTTNFIHGSPPYAVSIALQHGDETVLGVVYEITMREVFAVAGEGMPTLNGKAIKTSKVSSLNGTLLATGFPFINFNRIDPYMEVLKKFMLETQGVRRLGSAATDLAYVACGRYEGFYEYNLSPWDVAAGALLVKRAGGKVQDFRGGEDYLYGREIIAAASGVFEEISGIIREHLGS
ncbi:MAG: inositol monophosphatase [Bacteroidales bacterium]|nr:inositol monophosphatase [Bacteroidales bacterium]